MIEGLVKNYEAIFMLSPIVIGMMTYVLLKVLLKHKWKVIHLTAQVSAPFLLIATTYFVRNLYEIDIFYYCIIFFLMIIMLHLIVQWKRDTEVVLKKALKLALRVIFLIFFLPYIVLGILYLLEIFA